MKPVHDPELSREAALQAAQRLRESGHEALFAGGCVRDELLGRPPKDYDVATSAEPAAVCRLFERRVEVGMQFGVVVVMDFGVPIEVATFRTDGVYSDGRRPDSVVFATAEEDAKRRDFTVNGLFFDPVRNEVIDFVQGRADLKNGVLRAIGDPAARIREDRLRLLRAVRFAADLGFQIDPATWQAVVDFGAEIIKVSPERIREELVRIFCHPQRLAGFDLLDASGMLEAVIPEFAALKGCEQPPEFHPEGDVFKHTRLMLSLLPEQVSVPLVFGVLLHDIGKPPTRIVDETGRARFNGHDRVGAAMAERIMEGLRFSRLEIDETVELVRQHMVFKDVQQMRVAKLKRFMARATFPDELRLHRVDCLGSHGMLDNWDFLLEKEDEFASEPLIPPPLLNGRDLIERAWKPGPEIGRILEEVQTLQLEGKLQDREQALSWLAEKRPG